MEFTNLSEEKNKHSHLVDIGKGIAGSAHGIKNILNNFDGGAYIIENGISNKNVSNVDKGWSIMKRNSQLLRDMIIQLLTYARPRDPEYKLTDINELCKDVVEMIKNNASSRPSQADIRLCSITAAIKDKTIKIMFFPFNKRYFSGFILFYLQIVLSFLLSNDLQSSLSQLAFYLS